MRPFPKRLLSGAAIAAAVMLASASPDLVAFAQTAPPSAAATLTEPVIKALQEALNRQGIVVKNDGVLSDDTRTAIRTYQSQHHLPVTGEPDKATLDKLGVRLSATQSPPVAQSAPQTSGQSGQMPPSGMMMNCPMMQGHAQGQTQGQAQMQAMMQMMQGMTGMMQMMQSMMGAMQNMQGRSGQIPPG
jgi:hypothetical protein